MPAIDFTPPPRESYRFVLRRYDRAPNRSIRVTGYSEVVHSRAVAMNGVTAQTIFVRSPHLAKRAWKLGWKDETKAWDEFLNGHVKLNEEQQAFYDTLVQHGPLTKAQLIKRCRLADEFNYRKVLGFLREAELVEKVGTNRTSKYKAC